MFLHTLLPTSFLTDFPPRLAGCLSIMSTWVWEHFSVFTFFLFLHRTWLRTICSRKLLITCLRMGHGQWVMYIPDIKNDTELNVNKKTTYPRMWDAARAELRGRLVALSADIQHERESLVNNPSSCLKGLREEGQKKPTARRRKEGVQTREEIKKMENRETIEKIGGTEIWFMKKKINKTDKPLVRLTKRKREDTNYQ